MIVKIKDSGTKWVLFDNAESVQIDTDVQRFVSKDELEFELAADDSTQISLILPGVIWPEVNSKNPLKVSVIRFMRTQWNQHRMQTRVHVIAFNTHGYLLNDMGKTIEKITCNDDR